MFQFHTYKGHDGVHFALTGGKTLSLEVTENGFAAQSIVYYDALGRSIGADIQGFDGSWIVSGVSAPLG